MFRKCRAGATRQLAHSARRRHSLTLRRRKSGRAAPLMGRRLKVSTWVGIDGFTSPDLIKTGTAQDWVDGKAMYKAWWQILPTPQIVSRR